MPAKPLRINIREKTTIRETKIERDRLKIEIKTKTKEKVANSL